MFQGSEDLITIATMCTPPTFVSVHQLLLLFPLPGAILFQRLFTAPCYYLSLLPRGFWVVWWVGFGWTAGSHQSRSITPPPQLDRGEKI